jgi:predicted secreted protein
MASNAIKSIGLQFKINGTTVAEVLDFEGPGIKSDLIDVTNHGSTGGYKEFILGQKDNNEIKFDLNYVPTDTTQNFGAGLLGFAGSGATVTWSVVWPDTGGTTWTGTGIVMEFTPKAKIKDQLMASIVVKPTGAPTLA